ncbi:hypothetical protein HF086_014634 [Spodoptera exigua]|uniref:Uncharacterized protein n=1 Tax=Spodoptera exigua TaxID=7107 RepID=A0A922M6L2_SPOEX|nr:hypothetical protein HF086_014634 [Spodoptera exigua]
MAHIEKMYGHVMTHVEKMEYLYYSHYDPLVVDPTPLEAIMPELIAGDTTTRWPRDRRVLRALLELSRADSVPPEAEREDILRYPGLVEAIDATGGTALHAAARGAWSGHEAVVSKLLAAGADPDKADAEGRTPLIAAAYMGHADIVKALLDAGAQIDHADDDEVCEALLEAGAKVDEADNDGKGPLMLAAQEGHTRLVELLIDTWDARVEQRAHDGKTAFRLAALEGHVGTVEALYARGADADALDADRRSTLYVLALDNRLAMAAHLLTHCRAHGRTPLHVSAWQGHTDMVNLLIKVGEWNFNDWRPFDVTTSYKLVCRVTLQETALRSAHIMRSQ